jgi:hypothetical protein
VKPTSIEQIYISAVQLMCTNIFPRIATKRLSVDGRGRVVYQYKQPFRNGSTHVVLEPLDFIAQLAALVPRPRLNLTRFHGVFAPNFKHRARILPWRARGRVFAIDIETCPERRNKIQIMRSQVPPLAELRTKHARN